MNKEQIIQIDANGEGLGGINPDLRIPLTEESVYAMYVEDFDIVLEFAIMTLEEMK